MRRWMPWAAGVVALLVAGGLFWFQPWKLFTSKTVNDAVPAIAATGAARGTTTAQPVAAVLVAQGTLITHEHATSGTVQLVRLPTGRYQLILRDLSTSDGPDLRVWLTDQEVVPGSEGWAVFDDGPYVELGRLKGNHGTQVYDVPAGVDATQYRSVSIWCKRFSVSFGAAALT